MSTYEPYPDDEIEDDEIEAEAPAEPDADEAAVNALADLADEYSAADPRRRRELWAGLDPDEQAHLQAMGIAGPVSATVDEDFEPVAPSDPGYRSIVAQSVTIVKGGLRQIHSGALDVDPELAAEIEELSERADRFTDEAPVRGKLLQQAAHLVEQAQQAAREAIPFNENDVIQRVAHGLQADGRYLTIVTDRRHRTREIWITPEELEEAEAALAEEESGKPMDLPHPNEVSLDEVASWSYSKYRAWAEKYPDEEERLLQAASLLAMSER